VDKANKQNLSHEFRELVHKFVEFAAKNMLRIA